jgi:hypothetical protein
MLDRDGYSHFHRAVRPHERPTDPAGEPVFNESSLKERSLCPIG